MEITSVGKYYKSCESELNYIMRCDSQRFLKYIPCICQGIVEKLLKYVAYIFDKDLLTSILGTQNLKKINEVLIRNKLVIELSNRDIIFIDSYSTDQNYPGYEINEMKIDEVKECILTTVRIKEKIDSFISRNISK